jgi:hypothetical protein
VLEAIGDRRDVVEWSRRVGGGLSRAPLVCDRTPVEQLVLVAGLIPVPGEAARDWWT